MMVVDLDWSLACHVDVLWRTGWTCRVTDRYRVILGQCYTVLDGNVKPTQIRLFRDKCSQILGYPTYFWNRSSKWIQLCSQLCFEKSIIKHVWINTCDVVSKLPPQASISRIVFHEMDIFNGEETYAIPLVAAATRLKRNRSSFRRQTNEQTNKQTNKQTDEQHYRIKPPLCGGEKLKWPWSWATDPPQNFWFVLVLLSGE